MSDDAATRSARLTAYQAKRDFDRTPEPVGEDNGTATRNRFVVQRHRARSRHYDLRLEWDGVLMSWAVPKGPTLDASVRRIAVHVEDHPVEYVDFEGVIPSGEYGGGDVIVWDRGTWQAGEDDPTAAIEAGNLHFDLNGEKLAGRFVLTRPRRDASGKEQWLLLHKRDDQARPGWDPEDHPRSVKSGRTNEEVAAAPDAVWRSDRPAGDAEVSLPGAGSSGEGTSLGEGESSREVGSSGKGGSSRKGTSGPSSVRERGRRADERGPTAKTETDGKVRPGTGVSRDELAALDELGDGGTWRVAGHDLKLTNLDKVLFPVGGDEEPVTKRELIAYYASVAPVVLRYLADRPVNTHRFPNGVDKAGFWQKEVPGHAPDWLNRWRYEQAAADETQWYLVPDSTASLVWLANYGALELHPWTSRVAAPQHPTWALFDIDPGTNTSFDDVLVLARLHRTALDHLGIEGRPKVSGQRGIQIWVPIEPRYAFSETRAWVEGVSRAIGNTVPELVSWSWSKAERSGRARLDYTQNAINKTLVVPYGVRPRPGAPVSVPLDWDELDDPDLQPDGWNIRSVPGRLRTVGDPFEPLLEVEQTLPPL
ncbi:non-homologous end-joining DNA ligase [Parasphingorhabdus pacifica]